MEQVKRAWRELVQPAKATLVLFVLGYFITLSSLSTSSLNGVTSCSYSDMGALLFGGLGFFAGGAAIKDAGSSRNAKLNYAVAAVGIILGLINIARGLGYIGSPCP